MMKDNKGFSLIGVLVAAGILGGLFLAVLQLTENVSNSQISLESKTDEIELRSSIRLILNDKRHCRISLAGEGPIGIPSFPVTFYKSNVDEEDEGLNVALYLSQQNGEQRGVKKFNGADNPGSRNKSKFGKLTIGNMKLIMNNGVGSNYEESLGHSDIGQIHVTVEKKVSSKSKRQAKHVFDVNLSMATNSSGETTILDCNI